MPPLESLRTKSVPSFALRLVPHKVLISSICISHFPWTTTLSLVLFHRQVEVNGTVVTIDDQETDNFVCITNNANVINLKL